MDGRIKKGYKKLDRHGYYATMKEEIESLSGKSGESMEMSPLDVSTDI